MQQYMTQFYDWQIGSLNKMAVSLQVKGEKNSWRITSNQEQGRLVCKGYAQVERINFEETFSSIPRMEAIRMFLTYSCSRKIKVYQMDVKSSFLNGELEEEVYIEQPKIFLLSNKEDYVYRLKKALYGLKKAPRAWYACLDGY